MSSNEQDDTPQGHQLRVLKELVQSEGWHLLVSYAKAAWGPEGYGRQMQAAIGAIGTGPDRAYEIAEVAERVDATAKAVNEIMGWPESQIRALSPQPHSRRPFAGLRRA